MKDIKFLESNIHKIETKSNLHFYTADTAVILDNYKNILKTPIKTSFYGKVRNNNKEKLKVISEYMKVVKRYEDSLHMDGGQKEFECDNCGHHKYVELTEEMIVVCLNCGSQTETLHNSTRSYSDINRVNITRKYKYDRKTHFRDCINQYQGKQNSTIEDEVFTNLILEFEKHHLLQGDKDTPQKIRFAKITTGHVYMFLKELSYSKHYENVNLIHYKITGKKPDDISHLEQKILKDFDVLVATYDNKFRNQPGFGRKNFINTQYVLYQLLQKYNHECNKDNFTMLKTIDRKNFHSKIIKTCFEELGWNYFPIF